jgi:hypothetical protein
MMMNSAHCQAHFSPQERNILGNILAIEPYQPVQGSGLHNGLQYGTRVPLPFRSCLSWWERLHPYAESSASARRERILTLIMCFSAGHTRGHKPSLHAASQAITW